ncbi:helix-turn-helix transcriptional regulator [Paractinoplanes atraurantiacus]|uniref:Putative transcriptional regulator n=1 Tax=Paractinoplanes atraurantiacus TaxID=1036182 RepID=A0A285I4Z1_9ACTN|nr:helix-turn-helix transcriptional regulator [Actinoplanes atraurantiacus]SNY42136.1 putative transcriptional regulator [Actinoplanes atraurantiacus]
MRNRLRVLRAERSWTQEALAGKLGVSRQTINSIETGKYDPSLLVAFGLAQVFDCRIEDIFTPAATVGNGHREA